MQTWNATDYFFVPRTLIASQNAERSPGTQNAGWNAEANKMTECVFNAY